MSTFRCGLREPRPVKCDIGRLATNGTPVLALIGREETLHDGAMTADRFQRQLPGAEVVLGDDANHLIFIDQQDVVTTELKKFLRP
ncbi:alpha/beta fold hydrolase [Mycobacterium vicinigordonae]|uniref:Alpha/beta hydrolase n=1 Tax=Mycobacterium vicinigordonae TaxID=1719132 RepID=A0A7D6DX03_9MYCO|nr:alpha/beta hydrolase [Mycobacterium vicinigordonae]QLL05870.1 alpha/beta hydrolase [Mycobacterium vicinigordonae]